MPVVALSAGTGGRSWGVSERERTDSWAWAEDLRCGAVVAVTDTGSLVLPAESVAVHVTVVVPSSITKAVSPTTSIGDGSEPLVEAVQWTDCQS